MAQPTPGKQYTTVSGDDLRSIAARAYGIPDKSTLIFNANNFKVKFTDKISVAVGEVLNIPRDAVLNNLRKKQARK